MKRVLYIHPSFKIFFKKLLLPWKKFEEKENNLQQQLMEIITVFIIWRNYQERYRLHAWIQNKKMDGKWI